MKYSIGFDLGGTKLASALLNQNGAIIEYSKIPTQMKRDPSAKATQKRIIELISDIALDFKARYPKECSSKNFVGIGLASAGPMNIEKGVLLNPINFPGWGVVPIQKLVSSEINKRGFKTKIHFQNDAMAAAFSELWVGRAKKLKSFALITVGTGIGTGVIFNGKPCQSEGMGSEFGHILIKDHLTVEQLASGTGLLRQAANLGFQGDSIEQLILENDRKYDFLFEQMSESLAVLCYNLSIGFNLQGIFISGGLIKIKNLFFQQMQKKYQNLIMGFNPNYKCPIQIAKTKNKAGVIGAGYLPFRPQ
jgi:glucokinase